jgi:NAD(P) transhydrogenase subunit alpha
MSEDFLKKEMEAIAARLPKTDVIISTAQVFGKKAPLLVSEEMVKLMPQGSVIVDLAAEQGGNCALTEAGKTVVKHGVTIMGPVNLPTQLPYHASQMYSRNMTNLFKHIYSGGGVEKMISDEIVAGCCACHNGEIVSEMVKKSFASGGEKK